MENNKISIPKRESNLELFRIITMFLIVAHHYVVNSGLSNLIYENPMASNSLFLLLFGAWGKTGINCFLLISGYFMCKSQITVKKFMKLFLTLEFYKIVIYTIFALTGQIEFSVAGFIKSILLFTNVSNGFFNCYLLFYLFIPFLNILVLNMNESQHIRLILLTSYIYIVLATWKFGNVTMNYVTWFMVLYIIASYIRLYPKKIFDKTVLWGVYARH